MSKTIGAKFEITAQDKTDAAFQSAHNHLTKLSKSATGFSKATGGMGSGITHMFAGLSAAAGPLTAVIAGVGSLVAIGKMWFSINNELQQQEVKLSGAISNTGRTLGFSAKQAEQYAQYLQNTTNVSKESVMQLETTLASSRAIATSNLKSATQAILDMAAATGKSADTLSTVFTEALANPTKAMMTLKTYGVDLNETQRQMIANAVKAGDASKAQAIIIQATEQAYKGQAAAMRNTMGGALSGLKHSFEDLFESSSKTTGGIAKFINQISAVLESPGFKQALKYIGDAFSIAFKIIGTVAKILYEIDRVIVDEIIIALHDVIQWIEKGAMAVYKFLSQFKIFNTIIDAVKTYFVSFINWIIKQADKVLAYFHKHIDELNAQAGKIMNGAGFTPPAAPVDNSGTARDTAGTGFIVQKDKAEHHSKAMKDTLHGLEKIKKVMIHISSIQLIKPVQYTKGMQDFEKSMTAMGNKVKGNVTNSMTQMFDSIGKKGSSLKSIMHGLFASIQNDAAQALSKSIMSSMAGSSTGGASAGGTGSMFASIFSSFFGGARAAGGPVKAGSAYLTSEAGAELFMPHTSGTIIPHEQSMAMLRGGSSSHTVNIDARGAGPDETAKLLSMRASILQEMRGQTEYRLNRNSWMQT